MSSRGERRLVPVPVELLERLWSLSEKLGRPGRALLEEIIGEGIRVYEEGNNLREAVRWHSVFLELRKAGFTALPSKVVYDLIQQLPDDRFRNLMEEVGRIGKWYGNLLKAKYSEDLDLVRDIVSGVFWDATEVSLRNEEDKVIITLISPTMPERVGELARNFTSSLLSSLGYDLESSIVDVGFVKLTLVRGGGDG